LQSVRSFVDDVFKAAHEHGDVHYGNIDWNQQLETHGYVPVVVRSDGELWKLIHQWCEKQFGQDHYAWTGSVFWLESESDATIFALRWG
jgi:hypothetical protein